MAVSHTCTSIFSEQADTIDQGADQGWKSFPNFHHFHHEIVRNKTISIHVLDSVVTHRIHWFATSYHCPQAAAALDTNA
jgi:hypothetical protein